MNKVLIIGSILLVVVFVLAVGFFVLVYPKMAVPVPAPAVTQKGQMAPTKTLPATPVTPATANQIKLTLVSPIDKSAVTNSSLTVSGETVPNADVAINELELKANAAGKFSGKLTLSEGENPIVITAVDANGNYTEKEISVTYGPAN